MQRVMALESTSTGFWVQSITPTPTPRACLSRVSTGPLLGRPTEGFCFLSVHGKPLGRWQDQFNRAVEKAGLSKDAQGNPRKISPYSGRYTFATLSVMAGIPDGAVRSMMRHSTNSSMLEGIYQRLQVKQVAEAFAFFPTFDDKPK